GCGPLESARRHGQDAHSLRSGKAQKRAPSTGRCVVSSTTQRPCERVELVATLAIDALPENEAQALREHIGSCAQCQRELAALRPTVDELVAWPTDLLRPSPTLRERLARRIAQETGR